MPIFERPPLDTLAPAKDRWTPIYLEHGRIEVDRKLLKQKVEESRMLRRMPEDLKKLFEGLCENPEDAPPDHPLQPHSEA